MRKYENLIKVFSILELSTLFIGLFIPCVFPLPNTEEFINIYLGIVFGIFCFFGIGLILLLIFAPKEALLSLMHNNANDEPYKINAQYEDFNELKNTIVAQLLHKKYKLYELDNEYLRDHLFIYYKHIWLDTKFFIIAYPGNMDDEEFLTEVSCTVNLLIREISVCRNFHIYVNSIHCVDTVSDAFFSRLKEVYIIYPTHEYEIRAGYAIDTKTLYIAKPYYGNASSLPQKWFIKNLLKKLYISNEKLRK